jgi:hypothetical protein
MTSLSSFQIANKPYQLTLDHLIYGLDKIKLTKPDNNTKSAVDKGKKTELYLINILKLLQLDEVYLVENYTILDCVYQVDIVVKRDDQWLGFQVKSGQYAFNQHRNKSSVGVVQCTSETESLKLLIELSKWLDVPIRDSVIKQLRRWKQVKEMKVKLRSDRRFKLFPLDWKLLTLLKLVKFNGEVLVY